MASLRDGDLARDLDADLAASDYTGTEGRLSPGPWTEYRAAQSGDDGEFEGHDLYIHDAAQEEIGGMYDYADNVFVAASRDAWPAAVRLAIHFREALEAISQLTGTAADIANAALAGEDMTQEACPIHRCQRVEQIQRLVDSTLYAANWTCEEFGHEQVTVRGLLQKQYGLFQVSDLSWNDAALIGNARTDRIFLLEEIYARDKIITELMDSNAFRYGVSEGWRQAIEALADPGLFDMVRDHMPFQQFSAEILEYVLDIVSKQQKDVVYLPPEIYRQRANALEKAIRRSLDTKNARILHNALDAWGI